MEFKQKLKNAAVFSLATFAMGCAHYQDVRPASNGVHTVSFYTEFDNQGYHQAIGQADHYCHKVYGSHPVVVSEDSSYVGTMPEEEYVRSKNVARAIESVGIAGMILGNDIQHDVGTVLAVTSSVAQNAMGPGYLYNLRFRCE